MTNHERVVALEFIAFLLVVIFAICQFQMRYHRTVRDNRRAIERETFNRNMGRS